MSEVEIVVLLYTNNFLHFPFISTQSRDSRQTAREGWQIFGNETVKKQVWAIKFEHMFRWPSSNGENSALCCEIEGSDWPSCNSTDYSFIKVNRDFTLIVFS